MKMLHLLDFPEEVLLRIMTNLSETDLFRLGGCCRYLHVLIHQNEYFWRMRAKHYGVKILDTEKLKEEETFASCKGIICDRAIRGYKELCLLRSHDYQASIQKDGRNCPENVSNYIAILGPGIDSRNNSEIFQRIFDQRDERFQLKKLDSNRNWTPPGKIVGAGVWLVLDDCYEFILRCLHTNSQRVRETVKGSERLQSRFNKLLLRDVPLQSDSVREGDFLQEDIVCLLRSIHGLIYTIDVSPDVILDDEAEPWKWEFNTFLAALNRNKLSEVPVLFLCLYNDHGILDYGKNLESSNFMEEIFSKFDLHSFTRPLGVFFVNTKNTKDIATAFEWLLYRIKKDKAELNYHQKQARRIF